MKKLLLISLMLLIGCATPIIKPIKIHVPAFDVLIVPSSDHFGYWVESLKLLIVEGKKFDGKVYLDNKVLIHEIEHMLYRLDNRLVNPDTRK